VQPAACKGGLGLDDRIVRMSGLGQDEERGWEREAGLRPPGVGGDVTPEESNWAVAAALLGFAGFVGLPFMMNVAGPAVVWFVKRDESPFVELHARESMNFQISIWLYSVALGLLTFLVIGWLLMPFLIVFDVVVIVVAALKASRGETYRYPLSLRLISGPEPDWP
jgi:hypothetical protein